MKQGEARTMPGRAIHPRYGRPYTITQTGTSLVEVLIAMLLSLMVSASAVLALGHSLGTNSGILQYTLISEDLRGSLQAMSRDIRRAGYTAGAQWCLGNSLCLPDTTIVLSEPTGFVDQLPLIEDMELPGGIQIDDDGECFTFELDRDQDATIGDGDYGGYRYREVNGKGMLMTWMGQDAPVCDDQLDGWAPITNQAMVDIYEFSVDDSESFEEVIATDLLGNTTTQVIRRIRIRISGRLIADEAVDETVETSVDIRNDVLI